METVLSQITIISDLPEHRWEELKNLSIQSLIECPNAFSETKEEEEKYDSLFWKDVLSRKDISKLFFLEYNGRLIGMIKAGLGFLNSRTDEKIGWVYCFFVKGEYQSKGYGKILLGRALQFLKDDHSTAARLCVSASQRKALNFYLKIGFEIIREKKEFIRATGEYHNFYDMKLAL